MLITAYLLDPKKNHEQDIAKSESQLEALLKKHKGFDLGGWRFDVDLYPGGKRDKIRELQKLIKSYSG